MGVRIAAVALVVLSLAGCVAVPPPGPSKAEIAAFNEQLLDKTWRNTDLAGTTPRPEIEQGPALDQSVWIDAVFGCMRQQGLLDYGISYGPGDGFTLVDTTNAEAEDPADLLTFYQCAAANAVIPGDGLEPLSDAQLDYIYDYYQRWLVPCVIMQGYHFSDVPTRTEFKALGGEWRPFYSVDISISGADYEELERLCGAERPQLY